MAFEDFEKVQINLDKRRRLLKIITLINEKCFTLFAWSLFH